MAVWKAEDAAVPRGDTEDTEVYRKHGDEADSVCQLMDQEKVDVFVLFNYFQRGGGWKTYHIEKKIYL